MGCGDLWWEWCWREGGGWWGGVAGEGELVGVMVYMLYIVESVSSQASTYDYKRIETLNLMC